MHRYTIKELDEWTDYELLQRVIQDRQESTTNAYSPLTLRLTKLYDRVWKNEELTK